MRQLASLGRVIVQLLCVQFIYLNIALAILPYHIAEHNSYMQQQNIVELHEVVDTGDGSLGFTSHLIKRPIVPEDRTAEAIVPVLIVIASIVLPTYSFKLLRDTQRRTHSPPYLY